MATPLISGSAALIRQFFVEKYYPTFTKGAGREINPSASLLKAMLIMQQQSKTVIVSQSLIITLVSGFQSFLTSSDTMA